VAGVIAPRFVLATLPTPLVPAFRLQAAIGGPLIWVKRDDLTGFANAGNKARALEFLVGDAIARGCDTVVTGGGASSNFCAAAAAAAQVAGLACQLVLYGSPPAAEHPNLAAARAAGAEVHFTGRPDREEIDGAVVTRAAALGDRAYPVPRGGATPVGALGYAHAYREVMAQLSQHHVAPGVMVVATGSGGTQAGLMAGTAAGTGAAGAAGGATGWRILGATVSRPPDEIRATVAALAQAVVAEGVAGCEIVDARGPGFGEPSDVGERAARIAWETEGLLLDPVYTAKAFAVVVDLVAGGFCGPIVFWHTGGVAVALHHLASERSLRCPLPT
jgi:1-aminocyclopropane-1-carboxylate deaminase/D-cysteine desulfhydrase-like pyridoxal-dependent ACC family enzyme